MRERRFVPRTAAAGVALTLALGFPGCKVDFGSPHKVTNSEKAYVNPFALPPIEVHLYNPKNLWWQSCPLPIPYRKALTAALDQPIVQLAARTGAINAFLVIPSSQDQGGFDASNALFNNLNTVIFFE